MPHWHRQRCLVAADPVELKQQTTPDQMKLSPDHIQVIADATGNLFAFVLIGTIIWAIVFFIIGLSVSWLQVMGGIVVIDLLKGLLLLGRK